MLDSYSTVAKDIRVTAKIKKCKFITSVKSVNTVEEAEKFIADISEEFYDARHNVYAFKVGVGDDAIQRSSDDGEPAGSSGPPALQAIEGEGVTNVAVVVTRYFGGIKHGVGGLIRAYGGSVRKAIREAGLINKVRYIKLGISIPYDQMGEVINDLEGHQGEVKNVNYMNNGVEIISVMKPTYINAFKDRIIDATRGQAVFEEKGEEFR
ncbi:YigZ family protein [Orenia marismortui]|uniref:YigZ family protein n=1 Tax=Orenia marismortui TaxID=46469 RepID=UPI0003643014|nr:YigZ family protein [Orenia marismortui]